MNRIIQMVDTTQHLGSAGMVLIPDFTSLRGTDCERREQQYVSYPARSVLVRRALPGPLQIVKQTRISTRCFNSRYQATSLS